MTVNCLLCGQPATNTPYYYVVCNADPSHVMTVEECRLLDEGEISPDDVIRSMKVRRGQIMKMRRECGYI